MGQKSAIETTGAIFIAFMDRPTWKQADLARRVGATPKVLKARLEALARIDSRIERAEDDGVWWSVPRGWLPEAIALPKDAVAQLVRLLARSPRSVRRDRLLKVILGSAGQSAGHRGNPDAVASGQLQANEGHLDVVEDCASSQIALRIKYHSASSGALTWRDVSVQRLHAAGKPRFVAICHRDGRMKWFRMDNVLAAEENRTVAYLPADPQALKAFEDASAAGMHEGQPPRVLVFSVSDPAARWVEHNLLDGMTAERFTGGLRVSIRTSAPHAVARFVVGLGGIARPETPELARLVSELAQGALDAARQELNGRTAL